MEALNQPSSPSLVKALAYAVLAKVHVELDEIDLAVGRAREAYGLLTDDAPGSVVGEVAALFGMTLTLANEPESALKILDAATASPGATESGLLDVQRAASLYRIGAMERACLAANTAIAAIDPSRPIDRARAFNNRGIIRLYLGDFPSGRLDFEQAEALYRSVGLHLPAAEVAHNRGMSLARLGDIPAAMAVFDAAEAELLALGCPIDAQIIARAEIFVQARLYEEVLDELPGVIDRMTAHEMSADADEGRMYLAQSMLGLGLPGSVVHAREVAEIFRGHGRVGWAAVLDDLAIEGELSDGSTLHVSVAVARRTAEELDRQGMRSFAAGSWLHLADVAMSSGDRHSARRALATVASRRESISERVLRFEALARLALLANCSGEALRHVRNGLRYVDAVRDTMEAFELRVHASGWGDRLARLGVDLAIDTGSAGRVLVAVERWRSSAMPPRRLRTDPDEAVLLEAVRSAQSSVDGALRTGQDASVASEGLRRAERDLSHWARRRATPATSGTYAPLRLANLYDELGQRCLIELLVHRGELVAMVVRRGQVRRVSLGPMEAVMETANATMGSLRRLPSLTTTPAAGLIAATIRHHLARLRELVVLPVQAFFTDASEVVIVPLPEVHDLPWTYLFHSYTIVTVAASARQWMRPPQLSSSNGRVVVVAGPGLPGATEEATQIAAVHPNSVLLLDNAATVTRVATALEGSQLGHLAAHATIRAASPLFSGVQLADGVATAYDLDRLNQPPAILILSACAAGRASKRADGELLGLSTVLSAAGVVSLIAPTIPINDIASVDLSVTLHRLLRGGATVGETVAKTVSGVDDTTPEGLALACSLNCFGRADQRLEVTTPKRTRA